MRIASPPHAPSERLTVIAVNAIIERLALQHGRNDLFDGVLQFVLKLFNAFSASSDSNVRQSHFTIWIDDTVTEGGLKFGGRTSMHWRFHLSSGEFHPQAIDHVRAVVEDTVGWQFVGVESHIPSDATPLFEYDKGNYAVYFIKETSPRDNGRIGYLDIDYDGAEPTLAYVEMMGKRSDRISVQGHEGESMDFTLKFTDELLGNEIVTIASKDSTDLSMHDAGTSLLGEQRQARVFYITDYQTSKHPSKTGELMPPFSKRIHEAFDFAAIHHNGQERKDPDLKIPYLSHLYGVAYILAQYGFSENVVVAGVLHDMVEDIVEKKERPDLADEMKARFGDEVYALVDWVTQRKKDASGNKIQWQVRVHAYITRIATAPIGAKAISTADKIHNIESLLIGFERDVPMWNALKSTPEEQIAKFKALHLVLSTDWDHPILNDLGTKIDQLESWIPEGTPTTGHDNDGTKRKEKIDKETRVGAKIAPTKGALEFPENARRPDFWKKYPTDRDDFDECVRGGIHFCVDLDSDLSTQLPPTPPNEYFWKLDQGGSINSHIAYYRLRSDRFGYFVGSE